MNDHKRCSHLGCNRIKGHAGAHTAKPLPNTVKFDLLNYDRQVLAFLDFETPWYADLNDPPTDGQCH